MENQIKEKLHEHMSVLIEHLKCDEVALNALVFLLTYIDSMKDTQQITVSKLRKISDYIELQQLIASIEEV